MLQEFELVGDITPRNSDENYYRDSLSSLLPDSVLQKLDIADSKGLDCSGGASELLKQNTSEVKTALIKVLLTKRERLRSVYLRKRQIKMMEKQKKMQMKLTKEDELARQAE